MGRFIKNKCIYTFIFIFRLFHSVVIYCYCIIIQPVDEGPGVTEREVRSNTHGPAPPVTQL